MNEDVTMDVGTSRRAAPAPVPMPTLGTANAESPAPASPEAPDPDRPPAAAAATEPAALAPSPDPTCETTNLEFGGSHEEGHTLNVPPRTLAKVFRTPDAMEAKAFLGHCIAVLHPIEAGGHADEINDQRPFMLSIVNDIRARDPIERMLAVQMAATHVALIRAGGWLAKADNLPRLEAYSTAYNKLARTYAAQMEALRKHRNGGQQKVMVEHVHVHPGGQAIVGDVHHGGRGAADGK